NFFNQCEWDSIMFHELNEGRPMLIGGWSPTRAHSYLCDGYDSHGYFHPPAFISPSIRGCGCRTPTGRSSRRPARSTLP
ncbi:MAG: C10 family peptidase, partial [Lachnospiraceae bacterium]|nr:C10 family peptidase [Lachnospiraceae bacterium]